MAAVSCCSLHSAWLIHILYSGAKCLFLVFLFVDAHFGVLYAILSTETRIPTPKNVKNSVGRRSTCLTLRLPN
jgi:hypothetical protein